MTTRKRPRHEEIIDGVRVRVYATRSEFVAVFGTDDVDDDQAYALCYPKLGDPAMWAQQARADFDEQEWRRGQTVDR